MMDTKRITEKDLLEGLDAYKAHSDELAEPLSQELTPLERLKGSVKSYDRPTDPVWEEYVDSGDDAKKVFEGDRGQSRKNDE